MEDFPRFWFRFSVSILDPSKAGSKDDHFLSLFVPAGGTAGSFTCPHLNKRRKAYRYVRSSSAKSLPNKKTCVFEVEVSEVLIGTDVVRFANNTKSRIINTNAQLLPLMEGVNRRMFNFKAVADHFLELGFKDLTTDEDRFIWVRKQLFHSDVETSTAQKYSSKSARDSEKHRTEGNTYFKAKLYKKALDLYTKSVIAAPATDMGDEGNDEDKHLAKCLNNRSAALFYLKEYKACIVDIEGALDAGYPEDSQYILYNRKVKCLHAMQSHAEAKVAFEKVVELLPKTKMGADQQTKIIEKLEKYIDSSTAISDPYGKLETTESDTPLLPHGRNVKYPSLSSSCKVMYDTEKGRYVVATKDILPGEVILVENPFSCLLFQGPTEEFCDNCCGRLPLAPIACQQCTGMLYCSPECRADAHAIYHKYECCMATAADHIDPHHHLALRTVLVAGLDELLKCKDPSTLPGAMLSHMTGCNDQGLYKTNDFNTIKHLVDHFEKISKQDMFEITSGAVAYTRCLEQSDFFQTISPEQHEAAILCVGKCLMHLIQAIKVNSATIQVAECKGKQLVDAKYADLGIGLYPTYALFNHSCASNSLRISHGNNAVVRTTRKIRVGEEVTALYDAGYLFYSREKRHQILQQSYHFKCFCEACINNWPLFSDMRPQVTVDFKCKFCQHLFHLSAGDQPRSKNCPGCRKGQKTPDLQSVLRQATQKRQQAVSLLCIGRVDAAFAVMVSEIERLDDLLVSPRQHKEYLLCSSTLEQCFSLMGNKRIDGRTDALH